MNKMRDCKTCEFARFLLKSCNRDTDLYYCLFKK